MSLIAEKYPKAFLGSRDLDRNASPSLARPVKRTIRTDRISYRWLIRSSMASIWRYVLLLSLAALGSQAYPDGPKPALAQEQQKHWNGKIKQTPEFENFTDQFYEDIFDDVSTEQELIALVLAPFKEEMERKNLRNYLDSITSGEVSDEQLKSLWWSSSSRIAFYDGGELRLFLRHVRDRL